MNINNYTYYFFVGIGGIGMSALARYFNKKEKQIYGYDKTPTDLTEQLQKEGMKIAFDDTLQALPSKASPENTLVIYTPAIKELDLLDYFKQENFTLLKRSRVLADVTAHTQCIAIAGTHGKTTTTTLLAHLLYSANFPAMSFLGGISENYQTNFLYSGEQFSVVEADEFDKSFMQLSPYYASISSIDADHLDIYENDTHFKQTFTDFAALVPEEGTLFLKKGIPISLPHISFATESLADYYAENIQLSVPFSSFDLQTPKGVLEHFEISIQGKHNIENATAALAIALELGIEAHVLRQALKEFKGIKRRFNIHYFPNGKVYIDDYAHHPTEINAALQAVNELFPKQKKLLVFQPHLYSRTRDFAQDFAQSLSQISDVLLLDIYPAREQPIHGITSQWLAGLMTNSVDVSSLQESLSRIFQKDFEVLITLGAGNIDTLVSPILKKLNNETEV